MVIAAEAEFREEIEELGLKVFAEVVAAPDFRIGAQTLFQSFGIGSIRANTILLNGPEQLTDEKDPQGRRGYGLSFSEARIRVLAPTPRKGAKRNLENLRQTLDEVRISAEPEVIVEPSIDTVVEQSADAERIVGDLEKEAAKGRGAGDEAASAADDIITQPEGIKQPEAPTPSPKKTVKKQGKGKKAKAR